MKVYQAINAVQAELSKDGITKSRRNQQQGYNFRGIDDVYNALSPLLAKHGLCILPRVLARDCQERTTQKGGVLFYVTVEAEFDFVCAEDGSKHVVRTFGEAMDSADKATNKAMSAAYKYAAFQAFAIPTESDNDADAHTPEPVRPITPAGGVWDSLDEETQQRLEGVLANLREYMEQGDAKGANEYLARACPSQDEKVAVWSKLDSKTRSALKKASEETK
jgi:hypothetical protein